jgi:protein kinase
MEKFKELKKIGDGSFGTVTKAMNTQTNELVAIKKMKQKYSSWDECMNLRELKALRKLMHPNIIKLKEGTYYLIYKHYKKL